MQRVVFLVRALNNCYLIHLDEVDWSELSIQYGANVSSFCVLALAKTRIARADTTLPYLTSEPVILYLEEDSEFFLNLIEITGGNLQSHLDKYVIPLTWEEIMEWDYYGNT